MLLLNGHEDEWPWLNLHGKEVEPWTHGVEEPTKEAHSEKRFSGGRFVAVLNRMRYMNLELVRLRGVEDE